MFKKHITTIRFLFLGMVIVAISCGTNFFYELSDKESNDARLEEARIQLDDGNYEAAQELLLKVIDEKDSNEARILLAAAKLGIAGFDIWNIVDTILQTTSQTKSAQKSDMETIFLSFTDSLLGTGEVRESKVNALSEGVIALREAPEPTEARVANTACFFAGLLAVPTIIDAQQFLKQIDTTLKSLASGEMGCDDLSTIQTLFSDISRISRDISRVFDAIGSCPFFNVKDTADQLNSIERDLNNLLTHADQGCDTIPTDSISMFPDCVQESLGIGGTTIAVAGDEQIATCELVINCHNVSSCFSN